MTGRHTYYHPTEPRYLTAREAASIQSFPNDFIFEGTISQQWRQIGNAVPPLLGKAVGKAIVKTYKEKRKGERSVTKRKKGNKPRKEKKEKRKKERSVNTENK